MNTWTITAADPPTAGAGLHLILTPPEPVADLLDLSPAARDGLWEALRAIRDRYGLAGYSWAVRHGETVVHVVAGGKAALDLTGRDLAEHRGPNDLVACPSESAKRRHLARAEHCDTCRVEGAVRIKRTEPAA